MKKERKPKPPLNAAHYATQEQKPAPPNGNNNGEDARVLRVDGNEDKAMDYSSLPNQNPDPVMRFTRDGEPLFGNPAAVSLLAFSLEQPVPDAWREMIRSTFEAQTNREMEIEHEDKIFSALFVPVHESKVVNVYCRNVTDRKQMQDALHESEQRLRLAAQAARICTWEVNIPNQSYTMGDNFESVVGFSRNYLPQKAGTDSTINVQEDMQAVIEQIQESIRTRSHHVPPLQYRLRHPETGQMIWVEVNSQLVYDAEGNPLRMFGMMQNITARKQKEDEARAQEDELQDVINKTPFMLTRCTRDLRYRFVSQTYAEMLGRKREDVAGKSLVEVLGEEGLQTILPYVERVLKGERVEYEAQIPFPGISARTLHVIYTPDQDEYGNVVGWFASIVDITARKIAEHEREEERTRAQQARTVAEEATIRAEQELSERKLAEEALGKWSDEPLLEDTRSTLMRYGIALAFTAIAVILRVLLNPFMGEYAPFTSVLAAVAFSVWYGGMGPGVLSTLVGYISVSWFTLGAQLFQPTVESVVSLAVFFLSSTVVLSLGEAMRRAQRHAHQSARVAVQRQRQAEFRLAEQQRAEMMLARERELLDRIVETMPVMISIYDPQTDSLRLNAEFEKQTGLRTADINAGSLLESLYPDPDYRRQIVEHMNEAGKNEWVEATVQTCDGRELNTIWSDASIPNSVKIGIGVDITERKRIEHELEQSNQKLNEILLSIQDDFYVLNRNWEFVFASRSFTSKVGKEPQDFVGRKIWDLFPKHVDSVLYRHFHAAMQERQIQRFEIPGQYTDAWYRMTAFPSSDGITVLGTDISERRRAERALIESARQQEALFNLAEQLQHSYSYEEIYNAALDAIFNALQCDRASILLFDESDQMHFVAWRGLSDAYRQATDGHSPWTPQEKNVSPIAFDDTETADLSDELRTVIQHEGIGALAFVPLVPNGRLMGKFMIYFNTPHRFTEAELDLSLTIARQLAFDIARKRAEERLRLNEEKYRRIVETANEGIWEIDAQTRTTFVNQRMAQMLGYTVDEMLGRSAFDFIPDDAVPDGEHRLARAKTGIPAISNEFSYIRKDGSKLWTLVSSAPQLDEQGNFLGSTAMITDITERKRTDDALRNSEERMRLAIESNRMVAWEWDRITDRVVTSENLNEVYGLPAVNASAEGFSLIWPDDLPEHKEKVDRVMREGGEYLSQFRITRPVDGRVIWVEERATAITNANGDVTRLVGIITDITKRKRAEDELRARTEEIEALMDVSPIGILVAHDPNCMNITGNRAAHTLLGVPLHAGANLSKPILDIVGPSHRAFRNGVELDVQDLPMQAAARLGVEVEEQTLELRFEDGTRKYVYIFAKPLFDSVGLTRGAIAAVLDITERKRAEETLRLDATVMENVPAGVYLVRASDETIIHTNPRFDALFGYEPGEIIGRHVSIINAPTDYSAKDVAKEIIDSVKRNGSWQGEVYSIKKDGTAFWCFTSVTTFEHATYGTVWVAARQDISERKREEEALRARTEEVEALMSVSPIGIFVAHDPECLRITGNPAGYRLVEMPEKSYGNISKSAPSGERPTYRVFRDGIELSAEELPMQTAARLGIQVMEDEIELRFENGTHRYLYSFAMPLFDARGKTRGSISAMLDITDRKRTEDELRRLNLLLEERVEKRTNQLRTAGELRRIEMLERRQAQDRFAKSFTASPAAMSITRFEDGMYRNVNPRFIEMLGYEAEEVIGNTAVELKIYRDNEERNSILQIVRENQGKWSYETQLTTKQGQRLDAVISVVEIELEGEPHMLTSIMDITERNRILAALRASEQQLRTLFDVLPVGVSYVSQEGRVIESNRTLESILDITRADLDTSSYRSRQYIRSDGTPMQESEFASVRALSEGRTIKNVETGVIKENGQVIWTSVSATPIAMPEPGVVVITVDVTERKHMDDELRRSQKRYQILSQRLVEIQEEERRTISRELHDRVGQSLAALNLNLNFMNSSIPVNADVQIKSRLKDAIQLTEETVSTIRDVMADLRPPALDDYGLEAALNAYTDAFSRRSGIRVSLVKPKDRIPRFHPGVELTLLRIAQEALTNVARHSQASKATVTLALEKRVVCLTIEDNGEGIRSWQKANRPGSHGLKIMRERAETFGGSLQVQSFKQKGTSIEVKIPIPNGDESETRTEADRESNEERLK